MRCFSVDLSGVHPATSLLSYWLIQRLEEPFWVAMRGGMLDADALPFECMPPSDGTPTDEIVFVGNPLEGIEFANRLSIDGLACSLWALGVSENTPPVTEQLLSKFKSVHAPKETREWFRQWGVKGVGHLDLPEVAGKDRGDAPRGEAMRIVVADRAQLKQPIPFPAEVRYVRWWGAPGEDELPDDYERVELQKANAYATRATRRVVSIEHIVALAQWADVCLVDGMILDDPIRLVFEAHGTPCVPSRPGKGQWTRLADAAQMARAGVLRPMFTEVEREAAAERRASVRDDDVHFNSGEPTPQLAIVIPFGGLPLDGLARCLKRLRRAAPEGTQIILSHQLINGVPLAQDEDEALEDLCARHGAIKTKAKRSDKDWNLSKARNDGLLELDGGTETHVMFLDADIMVDRGFFNQLIPELGPCPLVPFVRNEDGTTRIASGLATYPRKLLEVTGGFDESYVGWGYEDLDLLKRCRDLGRPALFVGTPAMPFLRHVDHESRWVDSRQANLERWQLVSKTLS